MIDEPIGHAHQQTTDDVAERSESQVVTYARERDGVNSTEADPIEDEAHGQEEHVRHAVLETTGDER